MKILFISTRLPHAKVVSGHLIVYQRVRRLVERGHQVGLAVFAREDDAAHLADVRPMVCELDVVPSPQRQPVGRRLLDNLFRPVPSRFAAFRSADMFRRVGDMVERSRYDAVVAEFGVMGQYLNQNPYLPAVRKIISVHQCYTLASQKALDLPGYSMLALREWFGLQRLQKYEFEMYRSADRILVLSSEVRYGLLSFAPDLQVMVIPSGVDTVYFHPADRPTKELALVFTGYYSDEPNRDAVIWFCHTVWPRLKSKYPDLTFYVVGPEPTPAMLELARRDPRIIITGEVDDIRPYLAKARVFVCPNRLGSGMRGKILQAMACGVPVVSTMLGAEGIPLQMGENGFLADQPSIMAQYIDLLLSDPTLQTSVARHAREMVAERFSWDRGVDQLEHLLGDVAARR
ncbi:MAG: glycosyltransferase [Verrucomicrobiota bacterium]